MRLLLAAVCLASATVFAAPLSEADEAKMLGSWIVSTPGSVRLYEITEGRNVKISGGALQDRRGQLKVASDGAFLLELDRAETLRIVFAPALDQLTVELFKSKKDMESGGQSMWKTVGLRRTP